MTVAVDSQEAYDSVQPPMLRVALTQGEYPTRCARVAYTRGCCVDRFRYFGGDVLLAPMTLPTTVPHTAEGTWAV